jgi:fimbrial chaperone protein
VAASRIIRKITILGALCFSAALAFNFSISPVVIEIDPSKRLEAETTVQNTSDKPIEFVVSVASWSLAENKDVYVATRDVIVNPAKFTLAANSKQVLRIAVRKKPDRSELTYRLFVNQQPPKTTPNGGKDDAVNLQLNAVLNIALPIYITSPSTKPTSIHTLRRDGDDLLLSLENKGSRRQVYRNLIIQASDKVAKIDPRAVLISSKYELRLDDWGKLSGKLGLSYQDVFSKDQNETLDIPAR